MCYVFFLNSFIKMLFTYHKIYPVKVYNSLLFFSVSQSCAIITSFWFQNIFTIPQRNSPSISSYFPFLLFSLPPPASVNHESIFSLYPFPILDFSYKRNQLFVVPCDWCLSLNMIFWRFLHVVAYISISFPFYCQISLLCMNRPHFVSSWIS